MILVDTSALIDSLTGPRRSATVLRGWIEQGERLALPTLVVYEWLRGPRLESELRAQAALFPPETWLSFEVAEARLAAELYKTLPRARGREIDIAIAAHARVREASIWTLNPEDFDDIPGVALA